MAKFQIHLPRTVQVVVPKTRRDNSPVPTRLIEEPAPQIEGQESSPAPPPGPTPAEILLTERVQQLEQEVMVIARAIDDQLRGLAALEATREAEFRQLAVRLAMIAVRTVLREVNATSDQRLEQLINDGLGQIPSRDEVVVRLHPSQCDHLAYHFESAGLQRPLRFQPDSSIPPGEVQLDHPLFSLASNLTEQLQQIEQALADEVQH